MAKSTDSTNRSRTASNKLEELARSKKSTKQAPRGLMIVAIVAVVAAIVAAAFFAGRISNPDTTGGTTDTNKVSQVDASVSGKSVEEDQKAALKAAQDLLNASSTKSGPYKDRMQAIDQGDLSSITDEMIDGVYFSEAMDSEGARASTYQSLIALSGVILEGGEAKPNNGSAVSNVQIDSEHGIAYVPLGVFTGTDVPFTFEMVYVDGEWKLAPFTLLQAIKMSSTLNS